MTMLIVLTCLIALALTAAAASATASKHSPRYEVAVELNHGLAGTPMANTGFALEAAGWRYHVHPALIAAIAGIESCWGRCSCPGNRWNMWGLGSCGDAWTPPTFATATTAYAYVARFLRERWPSARTPYDFHGYCRTRSGAECPTWPSKVAWNMDRLGFPARVEYGR